MRKLHREIARALERAGYIVAEYHEHKGHVTYVLELHGRQRKLRCAGTPRDAGVTCKKALKDARQMFEKPLR